MCRVLLKYLNVRVIVNFVFFRLDINEVELMKGLYFERVLVC